MSSQLTTMKSYQAELPDRHGVVAVRNKYKSFPGEPFVYKFSGQTGYFTDANDELLYDANGKQLKELVFQPIAYRFFSDSLFGRKEKDGFTPKVDDWAEMFFIDAKNRVCVIMFSGTTFRELAKVVKGLYYDDLYLNEVVIQMTPEKVTSSKDSSMSWWQGKFKWKAADPELVKEYSEFERDNPVFQSSTLTPSCKLNAFIGSYFEQMAKGQVSVPNQEEEYHQAEPVQDTWRQPAEPPRQQYQAPASTGGFGNGPANEPLPF